MSYNANWRPARSDNDELFDPIRFRLKINSDAYTGWCTYNTAVYYRAVGIRTQHNMVVNNWLCV